MLTFSYLHRQGWMSPKLLDLCNILASFGSEPMRDQSMYHAKHELPIMQASTLLFGSTPPATLAGAATTITVGVNNTDAPTSILYLDGVCTLQIEFYQQPTSNL